MYSLPYFKENDKDILHAFMHKHPFILICGSNRDGKPVATHIPVLLKEKNNELFLQGHFMKKTDHHLAFEENPNALAIFSGPHSYVSASWYSDPKQASTWNYMTVHAHGHLKFLDDEALMDILRETTAHFENNDASPASFENLAPEYVSALSTAIIAFEIKVTRIENVFKLSQNRDRKSYENIIHHLQQQGGDAAGIAGEMKSRSGSLYAGNEP